MKKLITIFVLIFCSFSCKNATKENTPKSKEEVSVLKQQKITNNSKSKDKQPKVAYVCAENGLNVRDKNDNIIGKLPNAQQVDVFGYTDDEIEVYDNGKTIKGRKAIIEYYIETSEYSESVTAYVFEGYLCSSNAVEIYDSELCKFNSLESDYDVEEECLDSLFKFEFVSKSYKPNKVTKPGSLLLYADTFKKRNGVIKLILANDTLNIKDIDHPDAEENRQVYNYLGEIPKLNSYVISGQYWESEDVTFYDKNTGNIIATFETLPEFSPNNEFLIGLNFNPYSGFGFVQFARINDSKLDAINNLAFLNWAITDTPNIVWISNNSFLAFLIPATQSSSFASIPFSTSLPILLVKIE